MSFNPIPMPDGGVGLCTREQVKTRLGVTTTGSDDRIDDIIAAVLPTLSKRLRRELMPHVTATRTFDAGARLVSLGSCDLRAATRVALTVDGSEVVLLPGVDYVPWPLDALTNTTGYLRLRTDLSLRCAHMESFGFVPLTITGDWGIWASVTDVPEDVNTAAIETALSWLSRPASDIAMLGGGDPRSIEPSVAETWDIPSSAWRKLSNLSRRDLGVW